MISNIGNENRVEIARKAFRMGWEIRLSQNVEKADEMRKSGIMISETMPRYEKRGSFRRIAILSSVKVCSENIIA